MKNKRHLFWAGLSALVLMYCTTSGPIASGGSGTETTTGVSAIVFTSAGTPAAGATVRLRRSDYVSPLPSAGLGKSSIIGADALTDTNGRFEIRGIDPGLYMIEVNNGSTGVVLTCSLSVNDTLRDFGRDTLRPFGVINAVVDTAGQKAGHLYAQVFGLERLVALDAAGSVIMNDIPVG